MAEGRFISRNIAFSEQVGAVSFEADYLFMRMLPHLDCEGRITGSAKSIKARCVPLRDEMTEPVIQLALAELDQAGLIVWYEADGAECIAYPNFDKHQNGLRKSREQASKIPSPSSLGTKRIRTNSGVTPASLRTGSGHSKGSEVKGSEVKLSNTPASGEASPKATPKQRPERKYPHYAPSDSAQLQSAWSHARGPIAISRFRAATAPLFDSPTPRFSVAEVEAAIVAFGEHAEALNAKEARWQTLDAFMSDPARWVRVGKLPLIDPETGTVTERGRLAAGLAA